jgi:hypothetical protein
MENAQLMRTVAERLAACADRIRLSLASVASGFALLAADLSSAPGLGHSASPFVSNHLLYWKTAGQQDEGANCILREQPPWSAAS